MTFDSSLWYRIAFISGACGLAYEILFIRLLSLYFGDVYYVFVLVLASVFLGLAIGYAYGVRWSRYIYLVELGIAGVAVVYGVLHLVLGPVTLIPLIASWGSWWFLWGGVLIMIPMVLIGASIPMLDHLGQQQGTTFPRLYRWYNLGAALLIVIIELLVLQYVGLGQAIIAMSAINVALAGVLWKMVHTVETEQVLSLRQELQKQWQGSAMAVLFVVSISSSLWYVYAIELSMRIFGPSTATISFTIALSVAAISIACWLLEHLEPARMYTWLMIGITGVFASLTWVLNSYEWILQTAHITERSWGHVGVQLGYMMILLLPGFVLFGSSVPVWLQKNNFSVRGVLLTVSLGNMVGMFVGYLVVYQKLIHFVPVVLLVVIAMMLAVYFSVHINTRLWAAVTTGVGLCIVIIIWWPYTDMVQGSKQFFIDKEMRREITDIEGYRKYGNDAMVIHHGDDIRSVVHLGYQTLTFGSDWKIMEREGALGTVGSLYHLDNPEEALFIGLGTGASVGAASHVYDQVTVYEINPAMVDLARNFGQDFDLFRTQDNVDIKINDGIVGVAQEREQQYDLVANITTLPNYYSANKIHALEFMQMAKRVLKPEGVYVGWLDSNAGVNGIRIYNDTLLSVFEECHYYMLNIGYYTYVCGDDLTRSSSSGLSGVENDLVRNILTHLSALQVDLSTEPGNQINSVNYPRLILWNALGKNNERMMEFIQYASKSIDETYRQFDIEKQREFCQALTWFGLHSQASRCQNTPG